MLDHSPVDALTLEPETAGSARPRTRLVCRIEGARDPNLLTRVVNELARRSCVPDHMVTAPLAQDPNGQGITLVVRLSDAQEAAHLVARFACWPCVWSVTCDPAV